MGLLEKLTAQLRLEYLSDLRFIKDLTDVKHHIRTIPESSYPLAEWNDAVQYLTGVDKQFLSRIEAKEFLLNC